MASFILRKGCLQQSNLRRQTDIIILVDGIILLGIVLTTVNTKSNIKVDHKNNLNQYLSKIFLISAK